MEPTNLRIEADQLNISFTYFSLTLLWTLVTCLLKSKISSPDSARLGLDLRQFKKGIHLIFFNLNRTIYIQFFVTASRRQWFLQLIFPILKFLQRQLILCFLQISLQLIRIFRKYSWFFQILIISPSFPFSLILLFSLALNIPNFHTDWFVNTILMLISCSFLG